MIFMQILALKYAQVLAEMVLLLALKEEDQVKRLRFVLISTHLPIQDEKDVPYKSTVPGVMHACGHDGHTATLLQLAKAIHEMHEDLAGEYVFIHQHAEEYAPGGAKPMIEDGCLDGVDAIFGTHLWSLTDLGTIEYLAGPVMAAADRFNITVQGAGGHGAAPHQTKDAVVIGAQLVTNLQQLVSRRVNPIDSAVLSYRLLHCGQCVQRDCRFSQTRWHGSNIQSRNIRDLMER